MSASKLFVGDPAPMFKAASTSNPDYDFSSAAGRYLVIAFLGSSASPHSAQALAAVQENRYLFDDMNAAFFGVSIDVTDMQQQRLKEMLPGIRYFWDFDLKVSALYGAIDKETELQKAEKSGRVSYKPYWLVLDPMMRVLHRAPLMHSKQVFDFIKNLPPSDGHAGVPMHAPVLILPRVFEPALCRHLIDLYNKHGGKESGFMREQNGKTVLVIDHSFKRRRDYDIEDPAVRQSVAARIFERVAPELKKAYNFIATRMERYIVSCYNHEESGGYFRAHRDNTTMGTAHRRFAISINLNAEEYEGGELMFPEFGSRTYRAPTGGAVVFGCGLLHEATPVTKGSRYAFLPFLYDEEAARQREENNKFLGEGVQPYRRDQRQA